jgi:hypothetical protein
MFKDENQRFRIFGMLEKRGRIQRDRPGAVIHDKMQTQMWSFLLWLESADVGRAPLHAIDYRTLKAGGDEEMLAMQVDLVIALREGHDAIERWADRYGPQILA